MFAEERLERIQYNCFRRKRELNKRVKTRLVWNRNKEKGTLDSRCYKEEERLRNLLLLESERENEELKIVRKRKRERKA